MKKTIILLGIFVILVVAGGYARRAGQSEILKSECERVGGTFDLASTSCRLPDIVIDDKPQVVATTTPVDFSDMIVVDAVTFTSATDTDTSIALIEGSARGGWYFEASFPIELVVGTTTIATGYTQAVGDWMTEDFVPYTAEIEYPILYAGESAVLILKKDNPSGLPENDGEIEYEVVLD